jgi:hypothetical protein
MLRHASTDETLYRLASAILMDLELLGRRPFLRQPATGGTDRLVAHSHNSWFWFS